jgi:pilus assembly protein CpaF
MVERGTPVGEGATVERGTPVEERSGLQLAASLNAFRNQRSQEHDPMDPPTRADDLLKKVAGPKPAPVNLALDEAQLEGIRSTLAALGRDWTAADVAEALRAQRFVVSDALLLSTVEALRRSSAGAGPLDELLAMPGVTDVLVNGPQAVYVDRGQGLELSDIRFTDDDQVRRLATRLAGSAGRRLDDASPCVDARLSGGIRLHAVLAPVSEPGTCISLRVPRSGGISLNEWVAADPASAEITALLAQIVRARCAFLISGGTGTGKTTLLSALLELVGADQRILIVEDSRELAPNHPHVVRMEARRANAEGSGAISLSDLVRQALRMRPDRLVLGEVRGAELTDMLMAMNTGHEGSCGTIHANSCLDVPARLEALAALGGMDRNTCHSQVGAAIQILVHLARLADGRRVIAQLAVLEPDANGLVQVVLAADRHGDSFTEGPGMARLRELIQR